jgi:hypothetical protein
VGVGAADGGGGVVTGADEDGWECVECAVVCAAVSAALPLEHAVSTTSAAVSTAVPIRLLAIAPSPPRENAEVDDATMLRSAADRLTDTAARTTAGDWRISGLLASRPEVVAHRRDGGTEHVAEARAASARWIAALSPAVAGPLADWLRAEAEAPSEPALRLARLLLERLEG